MGEEEEGYKRNEKLQRIKKRVREMKKKHYKRYGIIIIDL
jgi:hypothetical protein